MYVCILQKTSPTDIQEFVDSQVADFKKLRGGVSVRDSLPRTTIGKLLRRDLREAAKAGLMSE